MPILIKNKTTNHVYQQNADGTYTNLTTGQSGELTPEQVKTKFELCVALNLLADKNPAVLDFIKVMKLSIAQ